LKPTKDQDTSFESYKRDEGTPFLNSQEMNTLFELHK